MPAWLKILLISIALLLFVIRGGLLILMPLLRFAIPAMLVYGAYYLIKSHFTKSRDKLKQQSPRSEAELKTIEICSECGQEMGACPDCPLKKSS